MKKIAIFISVLLVTTFALNGCGGGGSGRYTVPPDIGGIGPGGSLTPGGSGGVLPGQPGGAETNPEAMLYAAWEDFNLGSYNTAIYKFNAVISSTAASDADKYEAYNGLGWATAKSADGGGIISALEIFSHAYPYNDESKIGYAAALVQRARPNDYREALRVLASMGLDRTSTVFTPKHPKIGVTNAEAHALVAVCYFWVGDQGGALSHINHARALDSSMDGSVNKIYQNLLAMGLTVN